MYDRRGRRLLQSRERSGVTPLLFARAGEQCVFASEIKAITALPDFHPTLDRQACFDFLGLGYVPEPATGFAEIAALAKGGRLSVTPEGSRLSTWHRVEARPDRAATLGDATAELER